MSAIQLIEPIEEAPRRALATTATPADLLRIAVESGADLDRLERLMALQERWEKAQAERSYNEAFAAFKAEAVHIIKNRGVTDGPLKGKRYAELFAIVNAVTPALSKHGLSASWRITKDDKDWIEVTCSLKHIGGHAESVSLGGPPDGGGAKNAIQARASTVTYLERYTLKAITGLSEQEDDDDGGRGDDSGENPLLDAGRDAAIGGMKPLTAWWGSLTAKERGALGKEFGSLKRHAEQIDREAGRA
jgi:hypothetical protein